jgi:hypothetical protein
MDELINGGSKQGNGELDLVKSLVQDLELTVSSMIVSIRKLTY